MNTSQNVGRRECRLRMLVGLVMIVVGLFSEPIGMLLYLLGCIFFLTGLVGFCPFYDMQNSSRD